MTALSGECGLLMLRQVLFGGSYGHRQAAEEQDCSLSCSSPCPLLDGVGACSILAVLTAAGSFTSTARAPGKRLYPSVCSFGCRNELSVHFH